MLAARSAPASRVRAIRPALASRKAGPVRKTVTAPHAVSVSLAGEGKSLSPAIASALFVAGKQGIVNLTTANAQLAIAAGAVLLPAINLVLRSEHQNPDIGAMAPATLAASVFEFATIGQAAVVFFGSAIANEVENIVDIKGAYYVVIAALAAAAYAGLGPVAFCLSVFITAGYELLSRARNDSKVLIAPALLTTTTGFALYKYAVDGCKACSVELTWAVVIARLAWGAFEVIRAALNDING